MSNASSFPKRIMYVDDEPQARRIAKETVAGDTTDPNFFVTCATGHELVVRMMELKPELILLDLRMPDMNGPDTIDAMRKASSDQHAPIIFVTERQKVKMIDDYKALGVIGVIYKPFDLENLRKQIHELWADYKKAA